MVPQRPAPYRDTQNVREFDSLVGESANLLPPDRLSLQSRAEMADTTVCCYRDRVPQTVP